MERFTRYVVVNRVLVESKDKKRWVTKAEVLPHFVDARARIHPAHTIGVFEVRGVRSGDEAIGTLLEWLTCGRPHAMDVKAVV